MFLFYEKRNLERDHLIAILEKNVTRKL